MRWFNCSRCEVPSWEPYWEPVLVSECHAELTPGQEQEFDDLPFDDWDMEKIDPIAYQIGKSEYWDHEIEEMKYAFENGENDWWMGVLEVHVDE